jgi:hypothetical protein
LVLFPYTLTAAAVSVTGIAGDIKPAMESSNSDHAGNDARLLKLTLV